MGIKPTSGGEWKQRLSSTAVGRCASPECKRGIFPGQPYARLRRPVTGLHHEDCVPEGAEVAEWVRPS